MSGNNKAERTQGRNAAVFRFKESFDAINERLEVCSRVERAVDDLIRLSRGSDKLMAYALLFETIRMVEALNATVERHPELGRWLARDFFAWPAMIGHKRVLKQENAKLLDALQLGKGGIFSDREWQISAPSTQTALKIFAIGKSLVVEGLCMPLTRTNKRYWFDHVWSWLLNNIGFRPEEVEALQSLGGYKAKRKPKYCKNLLPATQRSNARAEIKAKVWKAFDKIIYPDDVSPRTRGNGRS